MMRNVLLVSWAALDLLRPRTVQVNRVAKALRRQGWTPYLIHATFSNETELFDSELKTFYEGSFHKVWGLFEPRFADPADAPPRSERSLFERIANAVRGPSTPMRWADAGEAQVQHWARFHPLGTVISFSQPWASHRAVLAVKRRRPRLRWIAHFSDPWVDNPYMLETMTDAALATAKEEERTVVELADALVFVTEETAELVMRKYPAGWRRKARVIPHMLDLDLIQHVTAPRAHTGLRVTHAGSLYEGRRSPQGLFEALRSMKQKGGLDPSFEIRFVGGIPAGTQAKIDEFGLTQHVSWTTPLYYLPSLREMNDADVLVVIDADFETSPFLPSKAVDYLMFDRPMIGITPRGSTTDRFMHGLGYHCARPNDADAIEHLLQKTTEDWRAGRLMPTSEHIAARQAHDIKAVGERYVELIQSVQHKAARHAD